MLPFIIMAIIQGLTEFIPVSSSGHLLFVQSIFKIKDINLSLDVFLHLATLLVIIIYFFKTILAMAKDVFSSPLNLKNPNTRIFYLIVLTNIPTAVIGLLINKYFNSIFEQGNILFITWVVTALLLILSDRFKSSRTSLDRLTPLQALIIGLAQGIAVLPGISRSGITIITALILGIRREDSFRYSFLAGLPAMAGAFILEFNISGITGLSVYNMSFIFILTFLSGLAGIIILSRLLNLKKFKYFGFYLILLLLLKLLLKL